MTFTRKRAFIYLISLIASFCLLASSVHAGGNRTADGKLKVLYHIDTSDIKLARYAMALINKHIEAEGGPDKIDIKVVIHGPALKLFEKETFDAQLEKNFKKVVEKGVKPEMCQVSMKFFDRPLDSLASGLVPTEHPVAVKRIADLQAQGYLYIKP